MLATVRPTICSLTARTVRNCVAVKVSCARRMRMRLFGADDANAVLMSIVATPDAIEIPRRRLAAGMAVLTWAADSAAFGPAISALTAARATATVDGPVRLVNQSRAERLNHTSTVVDACGTA